MTKRPVWTLLTLSLTALTTVSAAGMTLSSTDKAFIPKAASGNQFELDAAKMAQSMGKSAAVMKADPSTMVPAGVTPAQQKMLDALSASGSNFDATYKKDMQTSHAQTYQVFQGYARSSRANAGLKTVVRGALPTVKMHLDMAKTLPSS